MEKKKSEWPRLFAGIFLILVVASLLFWLRMYHLIFADIVVLSFAAFGLYEMLKAFSKAWTTPQNLQSAVADPQADSARETFSGKPVIRPMWLQALFVFVAMYPLTLFYHEAGIMISLILGVLLTFSMLLFTKRYGLKDAIVTIISFVYPMSILMLAVLINRVYGGLLGIVLILITAIATDTLAFVGGKLFGRTKLIPEVSPKKTVEGAISGIFGGIAGAMLVFLMDHYNVFAFFAREDELGHILDPAVHSTGIIITVYVIAGFFAAIFTQLGDLTASYVKRRVGIKDFGNVIPGHGGVLDRIDGILFVAPIIYIILRVIYQIA